MSINPLLIAARHGPYVLIAGLVAGLAWPGLAHLLRPAIPALVAVLLFLSVLRMAPSEIAQSLRALPRDGRAVLGLQLVLPLAVLGLGALVGLSGSPFLLALVLMSAAPSIVGSSNICLMMGVGHVPALRLMVAGTALLPLTVLPVFWAAASLGNVTDVLAAALRLLAVILLATGAAVLVRRRLLARPSTRTLRQLDGASAIAMAVFVIGLMPAVADVARSDPTRAAIWLGFAMVANFGTQILVWRVNRALPHPLPHDRATALSVIAGNRNISLFFVSLPPEVLAPVMVFIGCYQIPMYLTPLVMRRLYSRRKMS